MTRPTELLPSPSHLTHWIVRAAGIAEETFASEEAGFDYASAICRLISLRRGARVALRLWTREGTYIDALLGTSKH